MNEKSRIMALVMTALLVIGAFTALAPVMSGTDITDNDSNVTANTVDAGAQDVRLMNFTVTGSGDTVIAGMSLDHGTNLTESQPAVWTADEGPIRYNDLATGDDWNDEDDLLAFDSDGDEYYTGQADVSLAGLSIGVAGGISSPTISAVNPFNQIKFKNFGTGAWESGQDAIIYDKDDDDKYSRYADTVLNTGNDGAIDTTSDTNASSMGSLTESYYMTSGKDDVVSNDYDGDGVFTAQRDQDIDLDGTGSTGNGSVPGDKEVSEGNDLERFDNADNVWLIDLDGDGNYLNGELFLYIDNSQDGTFNLSDDDTADIILDENSTTKTVLDNYYNGTNAKRISSYSNIFKYYDSGGTSTEYDDGEDIIRDSGGTDTYSIREDAIINNGGTRDMANTDPLSNISTTYPDAYYADVDEDGDYTAGDEIFRDLDSNGKYTEEADELLAGVEPSNGITITDQNPWHWENVSDVVRFVDRNTIGTWESSYDMIFLDYHNGTTISTGADTYVAGNTTGRDGLDLVDPASTPSDWDLCYYDENPGGPWTPNQDAIVEDNDFAERSTYGGPYYRDIVQSLMITNSIGAYPAGLEGDQITLTVWADLKPSDGHNASDTANETMLGHPTWSSTYSAWVLPLDAPITYDTTMYVYMDVSSDVTGDPAITPTATISLAAYPVNPVTVTSSYTQSVEAAPGVMWARTADEDGDGMVDHVNVKYTEYMGITGIGAPDEVSIENATIVDVSRVDGTHYSIVKYELANQKAPSWSSYADFDETAITDNDGNNLASGQDQAVVDWIGPYVEACEVEPGARTATITFSENVDSYSPTGTWNYFDIYSGPLSSYNIIDWSLSGGTTATIIFDDQMESGVPTSTSAATSWIRTGQGERDGVMGAPVIDATDEYSLVTGWNVISLPRYVEGTLDIAENATGVISNMWAFDAENQEWMHPTTIEPLDAVFVYAEGPQHVTFTYKTPEVTDTPPTKDMYAGWNFIGPNMDPTIDDEHSVQVDNVLASVSGQYSVVFSPMFNHGGTWTVTPNNADDEDMKLFEGYWVYMNTDGTLVGRSA